jgi:signal transduction histidine kinase
MHIRLAPRAQDVALAGISCLADVAIFSYKLNPGGAPDGSDPPLPILIGYAAAGFVALVWRRQFPLLVFAVLLLHSLLASQLPLAGYVPVIGPLIALYAVAVYRGRVASTYALVATLLPCGIAAADAASQADPGEYAASFAWSFFFYALLSAAVWGVGVWARMSRQNAKDLEHRREAAAREAVAAERARIARELHDIVAHSVTVMVLQAGGAYQVLSTDVDRAGKALQHIEELGKQAMGELRRLLVVLRADESGDGADLDGSTRAGLANVDDLLRTFRDAALPVRLDVHGQSRTLDRSVDLTAYRIVQEALTNVAKHAGPGTATTVELSWVDQLRIEITDGGSSKHRRNATLSTGHGLLGLQERVSVIGGSLQAGPTANGGFRVTATLPLTVTAPASSLSRNNATWNITDANSGRLATPMGGDDDSPRTAGRG